MFQANFYPSLKCLSVGIDWACFQLTCNFYLRPYIRQMMRMRLGHLDQTLPVSPATVQSIRFFFFSESGLSLVLLVYITNPSRAVAPWIYA